MATREDVQDGSRLFDPIRVSVKELNDRPVEPRDIELTVTDQNGNELEVIIWKTHNIDQEWGVRSYELSGMRGRRYPTSSGERVVLHSTGATEIRPQNSLETADLFVIGDTHVGFRHRSTSDKAGWAQEVDCRKQFSRSLDRARKQKPDAVIHVGDVFDHQNTELDRTLVAGEIRKTVESGIPIFYLVGNHDDERGKEVLASSPATHLPSDPLLGGGVPMNLIGVDHSGSEFPSSPRSTSKDMETPRNILVIHESPSPVIDEEGNLLFQNDSNKANIWDFIDAAQFDIDLVITGHLHVGRTASVRWTDIPLLVTGPTATISTIEEKNRPSTWHLSASASSLEWERDEL